MPRDLPITCLLASALATGTVSAGAVREAEAIYADLNDAQSVLAAIDSGIVRSYHGKDRAAWEQEFREKRTQLAAKLATVTERGLSRMDARVLAILRQKLVMFSEFSDHLSALRCEDSRRQDLELSTLSQSLTACFTEIANSLMFEGETIDRVAALGRLHNIDDPQRRKQLFHAFAPLWQAVNGSNKPDSPYRRLISLAAAQARTNESALESAARALGVSAADIEQWLIRILEAWSTATAGEITEPWDYRYASGAADRALAAKISRASLLEINHRYYRDLGADLAALGVLYDLEPRPDKSPVAYADFLIHGRWEAGRWQPTIPCVLASYREGSLGSLNELVHESGHAVQLSAIRNRPVFVDWTEELFAEAFADVSSWSVYESRWQSRYLATTVPQWQAQRALLGSVMLDVAWALFEIRLMREPRLDPNDVWTEITHRYLHIRPHPELAWWAVRVQLVDAPGYMVNYGLGAVLTADLRQRIEEQIGRFDAGNPRWYPWLSQQLLRFGSEHDARTLLSQFLGRPVSPEAFLEQIRQHGSTSRNR